MGGALAPCVVLRALQAPLYGYGQSSMVPIAPPPNFLFPSLKGLPSCVPRSRCQLLALAALAASRACLFPLNKSFLVKNYLVRFGDGGQAVGKIHVGPVNGTGKGLEVRRCWENGQGKMRPGDPREAIRCYRARSPGRGGWSFPGGPLKSSGLENGTNKLSACPLCLITAGFRGTFQQDLSVKINKRDQQALSTRR